MTDWDAKAREIYAMLNASAPSTPGRIEEDVTDIAQALKAAHDEALTQCRGIIARHMRYWEQADYEIAEMLRGGKP